MKQPGVGPVTDLMFVLTITLIMSDGSSVLRFLSPTSFQEVRRISVRDGDGRLIDQLNELEYVRGEIYANIWHSDQIARISPRTGRVVGWIGMSGLIDKNELGNAEFSMALLTIQKATVSL
jgi:glutaminyl-peptide cyclotransferase